MDFLSTVHRPFAGGPCGSRLRSLPCPAKKITFVSQVTLPEPISLSHGGGQGLSEGTWAPDREAGGQSGTTFPESLTWWDFPVPTGNYEVSIKFNDEHIPESPYLVPVIAPSDDARRLTVLSLQVRHKEASISLATGRPVRPWTPEAPWIPDSVPTALAHFNRECCQL